MAPLMNFTFPVGTPADELTVAVRVTACPTADGFCEELSDSVVSLVCDSILKMTEWI
jgi:hypothetical protein